MEFRHRGGAAQLVHRARTTIARCALCVFIGLRMTDRYSMRLLDDAKASLAAAEADKDDDTSPAQLVNSPAGSCKLSERISLRKIAQL